MPSRRKKGARNRPVGNSGKLTPARAKHSSRATLSPLKAQRRNKRDQRSRETLAPYGENRTVEALTVAWMLVVLSGLMTEIAATLGLTWHRLAGPSDALSGVDRESTVIDYVAVATIILVFAAILLSPINLLLTMIVRRMRNEPPPRLLITAALIIALVPIPLWILARAEFNP